MTDVQERGPAAGAAGEPTALKRDISGRLLLLFILGDVLGAGIYTLVGAVAGEVGGAVWAPLAVALALALLTACSYAELVTRYPRAGGASVFAQRAFGVPWVSFLVGFCMMAAGVTSAAALALAFGGDYLGEFVTLPPVAVAVAFLAVVALLNARGIKDSLRANVVMTLVELTGLLIVVVLGFMTLGAGEGDAGRALEFTDTTSVPLAILGGAVLAFYAFVGFETSANVAEETANPRRDYPKALLGGLAIAGTLYVLVGLAVSVAVPADRIDASTGPLLAVVEGAPVAFPAWLFSLIALVAVANGALLTMIMASRLAYGMAQEGLLPSPLRRVLPGRRTPWVAIVATTLVAMALASLGNLKTLAETTVLLLLVVFVAVNAAVITVRRRERTRDDDGAGGKDGAQDGDRVFRVPLVLPVAGLVTSLGLMTQQEAVVYRNAALLVAGGVVLWLLERFTARRRGRSRQETSS